MIRGVIDNFGNKKGLVSIYITSTIPSASILGAMQVLEVDANNTYFVDCISRIMSSSTAQEESILYVESPTMLEYVMLKVEYLAKKAAMEGKKIIVVLDSINSLAIHNNTKILSEFMHIFVNTMRGKEGYTVILFMEEQGNQDLQNMISFVCDDTIVVESPE